VSSAPGPEPTGWRLFAARMAEFWRDVRYPTPFAPRYIACDGCGRVTPHSSVRRSIRITGDGMTTTPDETVCDVCGHPQLRTVGDEVLADTTIVCRGRRYRRFGSKRSRRRCGKTFIAPAAASPAVCPWCGTEHHLEHPEPDAGPSPL
jgi:hypothetical protein